MGKSSPKAPDPVATAQAQADINRLNIYSPYGGIQFGKTDANGAFVPDNSGGQAAVQTTETPWQRQMREQQQGLAFGLANQFNTNGQMLPNMPKNDLTSGLPALRSSASIEAGLTDRPDINSLRAGFLGDAQAVEDATYQRGLNLINRDLPQRQDALSQELANRGISIDSDAFRNERTRFDRDINDQQRQLALDSVLAGRGEQQRLFGNELNIFDRGTQQRANALAEGLSLGGYDQSTRGQLFGENQQMFQNQLAKRSSKFNEIQSLLGGQQLNPSTPNVPYAGVDLAGLTSQNYNTQMQNYGANNQALGGLLGMGMLAGAPYLFGK